MKAHLLLLFTCLVATAHGETRDTIQNRLPFRYETTALDCAFGDAGSCSTTRRNGIVGMASDSLHRPDVTTTPARSVAEQDASVLKWVERVTGKIGELKSSGALNVLGALGGADLLSKIEGILSTLGASGGSLKKGLQGGNLLVQVQSALEAGIGIVKSQGLGDGALLQKLVGQLPALATQVLSGQLGPDKLFAQLQQDFGQDPLVQKLISTFGGLGGSSQIANLMDALKR